MIKRVMKRSFSIFLTLVLLATTFFIFDPSVLKMDASASLAVDANTMGSSLPAQLANAPETIYLKPGTNNFQYYSLIDVDTGDAGNSKSTTGSITFSNGKATAIQLFVNNFWKKTSDNPDTYADASGSISNFKPNSANLTTVSGLTGSSGGGTTSAIVNGSKITSTGASGNNSINFVFDSNLSTFDCNEGDVYVVEWGIEYKIDGVFHYTFLYTGFYKPRLTITGTTARGRHTTALTNVPKAAGFGFIAGAMKYAAVGNRTTAYTGLSFGENCAPLVGFVGQQNNGTAGQYTIPNCENGWSSTVSFPETTDDSKKTIMVTPGEYNAQGQSENYDVWTTYTNFGSYANPVPTGTNHSDVSSAGEMTTAGVYSGVAYEVVDTSRFKDLSQIPNFSAGYIRYYHDRGGDEAKLNYIRVSDAPGTSPASNGFSVIGVDTSDHNDNQDEWKSRTYGLYSFGGSTASLSGQKNMYVMYRYSEDITTYDYPIQIHIGVGLSIYGVDKDALRQAYTRHLASNIDQVTYSSGYASYFSRLQTQMKYLCDPTATKNDVGIAEPEMETAQKGIIADNASEILTFYVPEAIYLAPSTSNMSTFQYYVDRANAKDGALNAQAAKTSGNIYLNVPGATSVSLSLSGVSSSTIGTTSGTDTINTTITAGTLSTAIAQATTTTVEWTATYVLDGITYTTKVYSAVYAPCIETAAAASQAVSARDSRCVEHCSFIYGVHGIETSHQDPCYIGSSKVPDGVDGTGVYNLYPIINKSYTPAVWGAGENVQKTPYFTSSGNGLAYRWQEAAKSSNTIAGGVGYLYYDSSRYSKYGQIPNFGLGYDFFGMSSGSGETHSKTEYAGYYVISGQTLNAANSVSGITTYATTASLNTTTGWHKLADISNLSLTSGTTLVSYAKTDVRNSKWTYGDGTYSTQTYAMCKVTGATKADLRDTLNNEIETGKQASYYTPASWTAYQNAIRTAYTVLGNPAVDQTTINNAKNGIGTAKDGLRKVAGKLTADHIGTDGRLLENPTESKDYEAGDTTYADSNDYTGYTLTDAKQSFLDPAALAANTSSNGNASEKLTWDAATATLTFKDSSGGTDNYNPYPGPGADISNYYYVPVTPGKTMKLTYTADGPSAQAFIFLAGSDMKTLPSSGTWLYCSYATGDVTIQQTVPSNCYYVTFRFGNQTANGTTKFKNVNLTLSDDSHSLPITDGHAGDVITNNIHPHTHYTFIYTPNKYDVTYDTDGGTYNGKNDSYTYNDIAQYNAAFKVGAVTLGGSAVSANPTKTGYIFNNWLCSQNQVAYDPNDQISSWVWDTDAVIFKAQWTPIEYNIAFNANDGTGSMNSINGVKYNEIVTLPANTFTRANYNFIGWNTAADGSGTSYADKESAGNFTSNNGTTVTLYAQWQVDSHKAKAFAYSNTATADYANNATGGTVQVNSATAGATSEAEINYNASYTLKAEADTGYYFNGWFDSSTLSGNPLSTSASWNRTMGSGDANWYARFTVEQYNITMYRNYESTDSNVTNTLTGVKYGSSQTVTIPTRTGYTFNGWYSARTAGSQVYGKTSPITIIDHGDNNDDISLYAQWTANTITVAYAAGDGSGTNPGSHTFSYGSNVTPKANTFTAPASKTVTFNANGGSCGTASLPSAYTFNKWKSSANDALYAAGTATNDNLGANSGTVTLTAQWTQAAVTLPTPTRTGFTFKGWYDASSGGNKIGNAGAAYTPTANIELYAQWDVENHHVNAYAYSNTASDAAKWENNTTGGTVLVTNGTAGATSTGSFDYNASYSVTAAVKTGYQFVGWYTAAPTNGTTWDESKKVASPATTMGTADVVYYARFDVVTYAVTANAYSNSASAQSTWANNTTGGSVQVTGGGVDGTSGATSTGTVVSRSSTSLTATAATGYTFKGWFTEAPTSSSTASSTANPMSLSNVTAAATWYAKFDINTSTLTVKPNGGSWNGFTTDKDYTQAYGSTLSIPVPTRTGYTFSGWTKSGTFYGTLSSTTAAATYTFPADSGVTSTITAGWTAINYSITYSLDGGTHGTNHPASAKYDTAFAVSAPTKTGYTFTGWTVTSGLNTSTAKWGTSSSPATAISATSTKCVNGTSDVYFKNIRSTTGSVTLTATWQIDTHTVTLVPYSNSANTPGTWTANDTTGGTVSGAGTFNYNADLSISASAKAGYNFDGWYSAAPSGATWDESKKVTSPATKMGTSDITYYAKFSVKSFTVTAKAVADSKDDTSLKEVYASNAGCTAAPATSTVYYNKTASLTATAGTGYEFKGWFADAACTGDALSEAASYTPTITEGKTFYAKFTIKSYTVNATAVADTATSTTLSAANATAAGCSAAPATSTVKHGATVTLTATAGTGYTFAGWFDNSACTGDALSEAASYTPTITEGKTFYAKFTIKSYTVSATAIANSATDAGFTAANASAAGCTATTSATSAKHGATVTLTATAATGYNFVGWFNNAADTGSALSSEATYTPAITANSAFYAKFAIKNITVTFNENGGSVSSGSTTATAYYGTPVATPNVTKQGYALAGWDESSDATADTVKYPATATINVDDLVLAGANKTLYAVWKPYEYTIVPMSASDTNTNPGKYIVGTTGGTIAVKSGETIIPGDNIESDLVITPATGYDFVEVRYAVTTAPANGTDVTSWGTYSTSVTAEKTMPALPDGSTIVLIGYFKVRELNAKAYAYSNSASSNNYTNSAAGGTVQVKGGVVDGTVGKESESAIYSGAGVTFVAKAKTGYTFDGWYTAAPSGATWDESKKVASPATTMGASDITYYAKFSINTRTASAYAVYYDKGFDDAEGSGTKGIIGGTVTVSTADASATTTGSAAATIQAKYTQIVTYTADAATGYEFAGWYYDDDDDFVDGEVIETEVSYDNFMPDENIAIQGKFVPINFVVVLNPNGGVSGPTAAITLTYGQPYTLDATTLPIRTNYTFIGWSESSTATTPDYTYTDDICEISAATVNGWYSSNRSEIYAVWEIAKYIVTLDNQGGTGGLTQVEVTLNEAMPTLSEVPTLEGYTLAGYYNEPGGADASGKYYNADGTSAKNWDVAGDGILYAKWVCPVLKDATYDEATGKWTYIYENVNGDDVSATPSDEILTKDGISQNAPETAKQITSIDDAKTEYVKNKVDETQEINLNYYTQAALEQLYTNVTATNTDLKREDLTQVELNAYVANLARYTELEAGENKKTDETIKPTINLYETKDKVKSIKDNTLTKNDSVIGNNYGKPTSNDAGTFVYTNKWSYYKEDAVDYYIYTNSRTPVIALEIDDGKVGSSVTNNKSSYPTNADIVAEGSSAVVADKEGSYMKSAVPAADDISSAWFSRYTKANIGTKYDYNAKEIIYLTPSFTPTSPTSTTDEIVYTITPSDDATEKNEGLQSAQIAEIPSAQADFYAFSDEQQQGEDESITVCVCYHNAMNGTDDEGGTIDDPYFQMYIDQTDKNLAYADTWLNQMHLYRQSGGANNWEIVFADESVYPVEDETFKDTGYVLGSFAYIFDATNEAAAASYAEAGNFEAAKNEIISSIKKNPTAAQTGILTADGHYEKYGLGFFALSGWSNNYYPKQGSYVYAHLVDRWGNVFNKVWKNFKVDDYTAVITGNAMNGFTVTEDGGSNVAIIEIGCDDVGFITDLDSSFENDIFTTSGDTFTVITNKPKSNVTFAVTDKAGNQIKGKVPTDAEGNIKLTVKDLCADLSDGAYVFMVNDKEVHLNACEPAIVRAASMPSTAFFGDEVLITIKTIDTASKVQLDENGSTRTYTKTSSAATIVDNGDGTKTWTIKVTNFTKGDHTFAVKAKDNNVWYDSDFVLTTTITKRPSATKKAIISVENVNSYMNEKISVKVEVKPETSAVRVTYDPTGYTTTVGREDCTVETTENGTEIWTVPAMTFAKVGEYEINVFARYNSSWQTTLGETCKVTVTEKPVPGAVIYNVDISKTDLRRGELTTLTVTTNSVTSKLLLVYSGTTTTFSKTNAQVTTNEDGTLTWVIDKSFNTYGDIDIVFKAKSSALGWTEEQTFGTVTVTSSRAK